MKYTLRINLKDATSDNIECIGHYFPGDVPGFLVVVHEDQSQLLINLSEVRSIVIPKEVYEMRVAAEQARIAAKLPTP